MKRLISVVMAVTITGSCVQRTKGPAEAQPKAFGAAVVLVSGEKQLAGVGSQLDQPLVVQVNDAQGAAVAGALVTFSVAGGVTLNPDHGLTGSDGQLSTSVSLGGFRGRYQIAAATRDASGKRSEVRIDEIALGYQEMLGEK
ncbi:MAG: Ig-like domain-containing protein, partial [Terriglobales bacterium]